MAKKRRKPRKRQTFWLNQDSPFCDYIVELKQEKLFASSVRDGLRLIEDLRKGNVEVLKEMFPEALKSEIDEETIRRIIQDEMKKGEVSRRDLPIYEQQSVVIALPLTLNDFPELQAKRAKTNGQSSQNLLNAMSAMSGAVRINLKLEAKAESKNNIIAGSDVALTEPSFDELTLEL